MLPPVVLSASSPSRERRATLSRAFAASERAAEVGAAAPEDAVVIAPAAWAHDDFDLCALDDEVWACIARRGRCELHVADDGAPPERLAEVAWQVAIRFQRFDIPSNPAAATPLFQGILAAHGELFDRTRPLVAADHDHALDTWRWLLRLAPDAGLALQIAALFHDVERLVTEAEARVEQHARDYHAFKRAHAEAGARMVSELLSRLQTPREVIESSFALVAHHEAAPSAVSGAGPLVNADALSFFSLNAPGFARHFGPAHTERKVAYTAGRLDATGRSWLARVKLTGATRALVAEARASA
ncbi:MAG TPA: DUF4202 family protein [Polyangia bacterium]|nr:DUF4202 family protein [Polyangia bacterium]